MNNDVITKIMTAQKVRLKNYRNGGYIRFQDILLEPGEKYNITIKKIQNEKTS